MENSDFVDFGAPAILRKWRSISNQRAPNAKWPHPYLIVEGTLDECIEKFMAQPPSQRHLYEIHALPQAEIVSSVMSAEHIFELGRLREFL
jgi:hypothetical protein